LQAQEEAAMGRRNHATLAAIALSLGLIAASIMPVRAGTGPCRQLTRDGSTYTVCVVDLRRQAVRLFWQRADGQPYGDLALLGRHEADAGRHLLFATNAGMFDPQLRPVGLYVENGRELFHANTRSGPGNFHMKPNGVFYVAGDTAGVIETGAFLKQRPTVDFATQSGPMLVIDGRLHPRFAPDGGSKNFRDGIGLRDPHTLVFAISDNPVSFGEFARLFRDALECPNALFLDGGSVPSLYAPDLSRDSNLVPIGPIIAVFNRGPDESR
jgi:uncharacterized protein YigE (DUF2233 family)